jgi:Zn-dependent protease with chaperone function
MSMTQEEFENLVARLDEKSRSDPRGYKLRVILLALLGYGYIGAMLVALLALLALGVLSVAYLKSLAVKIDIALIVLIGIVLRAMWVRVTPPEGRELSRTESPALFAMIDKLRASLGAPRFHRVLIDDDFNAGVQQVPRLGIFGWQENYLLIGLPLMKAMTVPQLEVVLAHEFGHLAGGHNRLTTWIYRVRMSWAILTELLEQKKSWGSFLFVPFFQRYVPYFAAYSFPLARANEYEADAASGHLVSPEIAAEALTTVKVVGRYFHDNYWPQLYKGVEASAEPKVAPFADFGGNVAAGLDAAIQHNYLGDAINDATTTADTHPCFSDRLRALKQEPKLALPAPGESADLLLGDARERIAGEFDNRWRARIAEDWANRFNEIQDGRKKLADLETALANGETPTVDEQYESARLTEEFGAGSDAALELFRQFCEQYPDESLTRIAYGRRLLARNDAAGVDLVRSALEADSDYTPGGAEALRDFYWRAGNRSEADAWHERLSTYTQGKQRDEEERARILTTDTFLPHELPTDVVAKLRDELASFKQVRSAYCVRKQLSNPNAPPRYVIGYTMTPIWGFSNTQRGEELTNQIAAKIYAPGSTLIFCVEGKNKGFRRNMAKVPGARIL